MYLFHVFFLSRPPPQKNTSWKSVHCDADFLSQTRNFVSAAFYFQSHFQTDQGFPVQSCWTSYLVYLQQQNTIKTCLSSLQALAWHLVKPLQFSFDYNAAEAFSAFSINICQKHQKHFQKCQEAAADSHLGVFWERPGKFFCNTSILDIHWHRALN